MLISLTVNVASFLSRAAIQRATTQAGKKQKMLEDDNEEAISTWVLVVDLL
jgi:hypothetical protein